MESIDSSPSSPEFEFWMVGNPPTFPQPNDLLTADELFADGVLLPLPLHPLPNQTPTPSPPPPPPPFPSKKWKNLFKPSQKKDKKCGAATAAAELNINIWPFSRSRSAGNAAGGRPAGAAVPGRKASSAPCSRSNSQGDQGPTPKKWGPLARGGIHLGRSSPIWQLRRGKKEILKDSAITTTVTAITTTTTCSAVGGKKSGGVGMLNLNVNTCIGYGSQGSCRTDDQKDGVAVDSNDIDNSSGSGSGGGSNGNLFNFRTMFSKKVY